MSRGAKLTPEARAALAEFSEAYRDWFMGGFSDRAREIVAACATPAELEGRPALTVASALSMLAALDAIRESRTCPVCGRESPCPRHEYAGRP